jgi:hypothetical protein
MAAQALELHPPIQPSEFILHTCPSAAAWPGEEVALKGNPRERLGAGTGLDISILSPELPRITDIIIVAPEFDSGGIVFCT